MKRLQVAVFGIFLIVAFLGLFQITSCPAADTKKAPSAIRGLIVTRAPERRNFTLTCPWVGRVECKKILRVTALTGGEIIAIKVADETRVKKGTLLFTLGGPRVESRLASLTAEVASLKGEVALARKTVMLEEEGVRYRLTKKSSLLQAKSRLAALQGALVRAEEGLASYRRSLVIRARMNGLFTGRWVSRGQEVQKGDILCEIVSLKSLRIVATLFPPQGAQLKGLTAIIRTPNGLNITASVAAVLPEHTKKGATRVWIEGKAVTHTFHPGECVLGNLILKIQKGVLAVPASAIIRDQQEHAFVFIKGPKGYSKRPVRIGPASGGYVGILRGIQPADRVVIHGGYELFYRRFNKIYKAAD